MSHHLSELGDGWIKPELLLSPTNKQTRAEGSSQLSTQSHCMGCVRDAALRPHKLLFLALSEGDEAVWNLNYIFSGNGWIKCWVSKAICSFKVHLRYLCFEYESGLQRPVDGLAFLTHVLKHLWVTPAGIYLQCSTHFFSKNYPHVLTTSAKKTMKCQNTKLNKFMLDVLLSCPSSPSFSLPLPTIPTMLGYY